MKKCKGCNGKGFVLGKSCEWAGKTNTKRQCPGCFGKGFKK